LLEYSQVKKKPVSEPANAGADVAYGLLLVIWTREPRPTQDRN